MSLIRIVLIDLVDRIIMTPTRWTAMNVSEMLYYAGYELTLTFFGRKIKGNQNLRKHNHKLIDFFYTRQ